MRKKIKYIILCIIALIIILSIIYYAKFRNTDMKIAYCSSSIGKLYVYNVKSKSSEEVIIKDESIVCAVGSYTAGDYCCAVVDQNGNYSIALVSKNEITNLIDIPFHPSEILATQDTVYCHVEEKIFAVNISDKTNKIITNDVCSYDGYQKMFLSTENQLYFISKSDEGNLNLMCINENGKNILCNNIRSAYGFITDSKFIYKDLNFNTIVIDVNNDKSSMIKKYGNICGPISVSNNKKIMIGYYTTGESGGFAIMYVIDKYTGIRFSTSLDNFQVVGSTVVF